jgi:hypothetical protein
MLEDVNQCAERIADVESAYAPSLTLRTILDRDFSLAHPRENIVKIVKLNRGPEQAYRNLPLRLR